MVVQPFGVFLDALLGEAEAFGDGAAPGVLQGATNLHAVQAQLVEGIVYQRPAAAGHDASALEALGEPVSDLCLLVLPVDVVHAAHARQFSLIHDTKLEAIVLGELLKGTPDESPRMGRSGGIVQP